MIKRLLDTKEAAAYLGISDASLRKRRCVGDGPAFIRDPNRSSIRYKKEDLDEWIDSQPTYTSTAGYMAKR